MPGVVPAATSRVPLSVGHGPNRLWHRSLRLWAPPPTCLSPECHRLERREAVGQAFSGDPNPFRSSLGPRKEPCRVCHCDTRYLPLNKQTSRLRAKGGPSTTPTTRIANGKASDCTQPPCIVAKAAFREPLTPQPLLHTPSSSGPCSQAASPVMGRSMDRAKTRSPEP